MLFSKIALFLFVFKNSIKTYYNICVFKKRKCAQTPNYSLFMNRNYVGNFHVPGKTPWLSQNVKI